MILDLQWKVLIPMFDAKAWVCNNKELNDVKFSIWKPCKWCCGHSSQRDQLLMTGCLHCPSLAW
eukprot:4935738-Amphidinium_carterae.1